jgi:hypothetical protein
MVVVNKDSDEDTQQNQEKIVVMVAVGDSTKTCQKLMVVMRY